VVNIVEQRSAAMKAKRVRMKSQHKAAVRASISFPPNLYAMLEELAKTKKVSLAWVIRDAAERYVDAQRNPLSARKGGDHAERQQ
jgi:predicted DNA-binding ribbon-helix-helix protein